MTTQEITNVNWNSAPTMGRKPWSICPTCLEVIDSLGRCGCDYNHTPENALVWVVVNGFDLALFPWEDADAAVAEAEAVLQEKEDRPGLGLEVDVLPWEVATEAGETAVWLGSDDGPSELDLMEADLLALRAGLVKPIVRLSKAQMDEIEQERPGAEMCERPYLF